MASAPTYRGTGISAARLWTEETTAAAMSPGFTLGIGFMSRPEASGVSTADGSTAVRLTPWGDISSRAAAVSPTTAYLLAL